MSYTTSRRAHSGIDPPERLLDTCRRVLIKFDDNRILAAFIYGSALGERWRTDSDLDIGILDPATDRLTPPDEAKLMDALERATGLPVDLRLLRDCSLSHQFHILTEGRMVLTRDAALVEKYSTSVLQEFAKRRENLTNHWLSLIDRMTHKTKVYE